MKNKKVLIGGGILVLALIVGAAVYYGGGEQFQGRLSRFMGNTNTERVKTTTDPFKKGGSLNTERAKTTTDPFKKVGSLPKVDKSIDSVDREQVVDESIDEEPVVEEPVVEEPAVEEPVVVEEPAVDTSPYESLPQIFLATPSTTEINSANSTMLDLNISAIGGQVRFTSADTNRLDVTFNSSIPAGSSTCYLVNVSAVPEQTLDSIVTAGGEKEVISFDFSTNDLIIDANQTNRVQVRCNTLTALAGGATGAVLTATLDYADTTVEWSDTVESNITGAGKLIVPITLVGNTVTNAF